MDFILTIDIGTTHAKALVFDLNLMVIDEEEAQLKTYAPEQSFQEQDPDKVLEACEQVIGKLLSRTGALGIKAVVFTNAMHSILPVNKDGTPLYNAIIWSDLRASKIANELKKSDTGKRLYNETGTPVHPMSPFVKILWLRENEPGLYKSTKRFISLKEYLIFKWFGEYITDYSTASASGLFDLKKLGWNSEAIEMAGLDHSMLPECVGIDYFFEAGGSDFLVGKGVPENCPVFIGGTDGCMAVPGAGIENADSLSLTIGTSAAVRIGRESPLYDPFGRVFNYYLDKKSFITGGPSNNGGNLLEWSDRLFFNSSFQHSVSERWEDLIRRSDPCAGGLIFLPYIFGERAPIWQAEATGSFHGIKHSHTAMHFARSVAEGLLLNIRVIAEIISGNENTVIVSGGVFRIKGFCQLVSDILNKPVCMLSHTNLSARGAAILALNSLGIKYKESLTESEYFSPDPKNSQLYSIHFSKFKTLLNKYLS